MRGPGEARLIASGALLQQLAQGSGLVASLSGYLLVLRNSVASAAVRAMAGAREGDERTSVFVVARRLYVLVGIATGLLIAGVAITLAGTVLDGELARDARIGGGGFGGRPGGG